MASSPAAQGALTQWRTEVQVTVRPPGGSTQFAFDGGLNDSFAYQTISSSGALSEASAELSAGGYVPTLRAFAGQSSGRAQAVAWGVQGYTNNLSTPLSTTLLLDLTGSITGTNDLEARVYLFQDESFEFYGDPGTMLFESSSMLWPGFESFANNPGPAGFDVLLGDQPGPVSEQRSFDFTVDPGDSFYVWARLVATADNPGEVDAFSTLTASLSNTTGLSPAAVPEPGAGVLLALGAIATLSRRRWRS